MTRFNAWNVFKNGFTGQKNWDRQWRDPEPKKEYDIIIIGGGLHGLATAYYLAKNHNKKNIAVLEKGWIGGGNAGRNTTIVRSNYMMPGNHEFYEHSLKLWENLSHDLNYNVMFSQRAHVSLFHSPSARDGAARRYNIMRLHGTDGELWDLDTLKNNIPHLNYNNARFPILGAAVQKRAGNARHDSTVWGFARACSNMGIDIIQQCEVTGIDRKNGKVTGVQTSQGTIGCDKLGIVVAGHSSVLADMAGFRLPVESVALQALVSEPIKPCMDVVVMANTVHGYMSQSDKGEMVIGGGADGFNNYTQRGSFHHVEETVRALVETFPIISRLKMLRWWGGIVDMTGDRSPIISKTPLENCFINCGWGTGGFKAIPGSGWGMAELLAKGHSTLTDEFSISRFKEGKFIDESVAAGVAH